MSQYIPLVIYLDTNIVIGVLTMPDGVRLSEFLNSSDKFLKFTEASTNDGIIEQMNDIYINKETIKFVKTLDENDGRGCGSSNYWKVKKIPVRTKMLLTDYELSGNLHRENEEEILQLIEKTFSFLPCTEVKLRHIRSNMVSDAGFVAINRDKVHSMRIAVN